MGVRLPKPRSVTTRSSASGRDTTTMPTTSSSASSSALAGRRSCVALHAVPFAPLTTPQVREKEGVGVGGAHEYLLDELLFRAAEARHASAAAALPLVLSHRQALDVAAVRDRDDHVLV